MYFACLYIALCTALVLVCVSLHTSCIIQSYFVIYAWFTSIDILLLFFSFLQKIILLLLQTYFLLLRSSRTAVPSGAGFGKKVVPYPKVVLFPRIKWTGQRSCVLGFFKVGKKRAHPP